MATTTQVTSYRSAGQPDDGVGAVGDICWDTQNRITWVKQSNNSWVNGAYSNIGPTGPAQLSGTGTPASGLGQIGNGYTDQASGLTYLKSSSGWAQVGSILGPAGPTGASGLSYLTSQSAGNGLSVAMSGVTLSSTATAAYYPGTTQAATFPTQYATQLVGYSITNPGSAVTLALVDTTASSTILSLSIAANLTTGATYTAGTYPMVSGHNYQWQASGSGTASFCLTPLYMFPAVSPSYNVSLLPSVGQSTSATFSSTALQLKYTGTTTGNAFRLGKAGYFYQATLSNLSSASLTFVLNYSTNAGNSYTTLYSTSVAANTVSTVGIFGASAYPIIAGGFVYWSVTGTGTGTCFADTQIVYTG